MFISCILTYIPGLCKIQNFRIGLHSIHELEFSIELTIEFSIEMNRNRKWNKIHGNSKKFHLVTQHDFLSLCKSI